ncbi:MAG: 23S rRNA (uracil(1939)-C(5))-methyltransferase RlmD [Gammaproteobacteria bacterium]|nr:23S rRNA (uracil(1939)-C(5))-methyltransferase RlmD [Gammaproteobacteria bacterium]|tara:strand:- start:267 stop:1586 length:1320 start_codon:yes stop_codon:yes gene_type:complete
MGKRKPREPEISNIASTTHDGRGVADVEGKKVFVAGALPGEKVEFIRRKFKKNFDEAELLKVIEPSIDRIEAKCNVFGRCGGCSLQHVTDQYQRLIKEQALRDSLERIAAVKPKKWLKPLIGPTWEYRRRARLAVKDVHAKGRVLVGFREKHAPFVTDMHRCDVLANPVNNIIDDLSELIANLSIRARVPQIEIAIAENAVALVFRVLDKPNDEDIKHLNQYGLETNFLIYIQPGDLNSIELINFENNTDLLKYSLPEFDIQIEFSPIDFVQINSDINQKMVSLAIELLDPNPNDRVLDLFCGVGNFSLPLARKARSVCGIEGEKMLVDRATQNAKKNGLKNVEFITSNLERFDGKQPWASHDYDRLLLDPARSGAAKIVEMINILNPERIVYVSCNPGTLARDSATLVHNHKYQIEAAGIIDMFPHTAHVESIAVFAK